MLFLGQIEDRSVFKWIHEYMYCIYIDIYMYMDTEVNRSTHCLERHQFYYTHFISRRILLETLDHIHTAMRIIKLKLFSVPVRLHSGSGKFHFVVISPFFAIFKNDVHTFEHGETPSNSVSHHAQTKMCATFLEVTKYFKTVRYVRLRLFFSINLCSVLYTQQ